MSERGTTPKSLYAEGDYHRFAPVREKAEDGRTEFRRDWARLIHSSVFRRLQGKTQLFPADESDFFRNRLTHSLEVAQIASGLALNLNKRDEYFSARRDTAIDENLVICAALAHDIGHPPFGHDGERTLNRLMARWGGFEGNAQTLRLLARIQKKETQIFPIQSVDPKMFDGDTDLRAGLNLTARTLASVLKYDKKIPSSLRGSARGVKLQKGYYSSEASLVEGIKSKVTCGRFGDLFKTIECSIMDLADDIAYSTYDLEDAFKSGLCFPVTIISLPDSVKGDISAGINSKMEREYGREVAAENKIDIRELNYILTETFSDILEPRSELWEERADPSIDPIGWSARLVAEAEAGSSGLRDNGYLRSEFTSTLVYRFMQGVYVDKETEIPALYLAKFDLETFKRVELMKRVAETMFIKWHRLRIVERRGGEIVAAIFKVLSDDDGYRLLPEDWQEIYRASAPKAVQKRALCDFISGMTDRYCVEFYSRITGLNPPSFHKPF